MMTAFKACVDLFVMIPALPFVVAGFIVRMVFHWTICGFRAGARSAATLCAARLGASR